MQHTAGSDAPALALDDIFHTMSPSPTPQPLPPEPSTSTLSEHPFSFDANPPHSVPITDYSTHVPRTHSPEPLDYSELEVMRARVQECALSHSAREAEFAAMVLRLASHLLLHPSPAQLASQAEVIADLTFQRNLLLRERAEENGRWQSERDQWDKTADALARKVRAVHEPARADSETQRYVARLEDDLKMARRKLAETQSRLSSLERELSRLRPLLSLHATILRDPQLWEPEHYPTIVVERHVRDLHDTGQIVHEVATTTETGVEPKGDDGSHQPRSSQVPRVPSSKRHSRKGRERDRERPRKHRHRHSIAASHPLLADARSEFILVAARKLGRLRAGILSGFVKEQAKFGREGELLTTNTHADRDSRHELPSPSTSRPRPSVLGGTAVSDHRTTLEGDAGSSSPPVPLAASRQRQGSSFKTAQRRLAPSPFAPGAGGVVARPPNMPTHLHPSAQAYPVAAQGRHPQAMPHPGFVYFAAGPGQTGAMPLIVPVPWTAPGTPPGSRQTQGQATPAPNPASKIKTPARAQAGGAAEGPSTPMDSLVSAARTLIEDEDYDGDEAEVGGSGAAPVTETEATAEEDTVPEETLLRRRGTRRRAAAAAPDSPAPKRRRTAAASSELTAPSAAGPSAKKVTRKAKAVATLSEVQEKPKARGRAKGKGKQKAITPPPDRLSPSPASTSAPPPVAPARAPHAPQVARIPSALDVLADQAAQEQGRWPSLDAASRRNSESEGREEDVVPEAARTPTPPAPDPVDDDVFAPGPPEASPGGEREPAVEPTVDTPKMDIAVQDAAPAAQEDADVKDANGGEAALVGAVDVPEAAASRIFDEDPAPAPDATPQRSPTPSSPPIASVPPPPSSPTPPEHPLLSPPRPSYSPPPEAPVLEPQGPPSSRSISATPAFAEDPALSVEAPVDGLDAHVSDVPPPPPGSGDEPGGGPGVLEIESSDEDAEGSIVDFEID
ncbi:hypothetical protein VTO73DRAFT_3302 [Trametes versicolor]